MATYRSPFDRSPIATIIGIVISVAVLYVMFSIVGWVISLLYRYSWLILIAALVIDYRVVLDYLKGLKRLFDRSPVYGLLGAAATVAFYPLVFLYFLGIALFKKKVKEAKQEADVRRNGQWVDYEEVSEEPMDIDTEYRELPPPPSPQPRRREEGDYDQYFK
ncbi:hypothetical protein CLV84_1206 [Neolewinella xylanilytica]|uniref:Uncharacterized protein n=1 Tax=Neolewinella xylanilytica TaxID=1514080 RepID=A0A2S6I9S5_9BACT|nr:hypothetical protein [Neolewinella xylanilytica]PPK88241.1 hypothetical protein CLV84_1206 [Neolewinella xylanilytica]